VEKSEESHTAGRLVFPAEAAESQTRLEAVCLYRGGELEKERRDCGFVGFGA